MNRVRTSVAQRARTASKAARVPLGLLLVPAVTALLLLALASIASADTTICPTGTTAGKCNSPKGVAVDTETGRVYVADQGNNRVNVFDADGTFAQSFAVPGATWIAVDNDPTSTSLHDVYVTTNTFSVQKLTPTGELIKAFGEQGNGGACQFAKTVDPIAVGPGGEVDVADSYKTTPEHFTSRIEQFDAEGNCLGEVELFQSQIGLGGQEKIGSFAVDSGGNFYVTVESAGSEIRKYGPSGTFLYTLEGSEDADARGIAVDGSDHLFAEQEGAQLTKSRSTYFITEYDSSGPVAIKRFGYVVSTSSFDLFFEAPGLAFYHSARGDLYASERTAIGNTLPLTEVTDVKLISLPPEGPVILPVPCEVKSGGLGNSHAILQAEVNPEGKATTVHFQYITNADFIANGNSFSGAHPASSSAESGSVGADVSVHLAEAEVEGLVPETEYRCRAIAANADAPGGILGEEGSFTTRQPLEVGSTTVSAVGSEAATLNATVNPLGIHATGFFEYVEAATFEKDVAESGPGHGFDHASRAPDSGLGEAPIDFGEGEVFKAGSVLVSGLRPETAYRFRIVASDDLISPKEVSGPTVAFRTYGFGAKGLLDDRGWELVSPGEKNSAEVAVPSIRGGVFQDTVLRIQAAAGSGEAATFTSFTSFGSDAEGAPGSSQYLSRRTSAGWVTENVSPRGFQTPVAEIPYKGLSPDLGFGVFKVNKPALTADCPEGFQDLYLRDNQTGVLHCLTPEVPQGSGGSCFVYAGASEDGSRIFFDSLARYAGVPAGNGISLYEWSADEGLKPVSVLPGQSEAAAPTRGTTFGPSAGVTTCQMGHTVMRHVISADGSRAFWTYTPEGLNPVSQLLVRIDGRETVQLDAPQGGSDKIGGNGVFQAASADGSVVYFTDTARLISGSKASPGEPDLYRYELGKAEKPLSDLSKGSVPGDIRGVVGASEDGSYLYFVAGAVLSGEEANSTGEKAVAGKDNLYLYHEGKTSFIVGLDPEDINDWEHQPENLSARVSPDGRHLAFLSVEAEKLAGYDNTVAAGEHCLYNSLENDLEGSPLCSQAFVYDAGTGAVTCASCNPSGARPLGPTLLPGWTNVFEGPRYLSDDGSRLFFESFDALSPADVNGKRDVYEFERTGSGDCSSENPSFDQASGGCHALISNGKSEDESFLIDASSDGRDVFFSTRSALTGWDVNENYDVYDAREGGGFPEPSGAPACSGESCKAPLLGPPGVSFPATLSFQGPGNVIEKPKQNAVPKQQSKHKKKKSKKGKKKKSKKGKKKKSKKGKKKNRKKGKQKSKGNRGKVSHKRRTGR